MIFSIEYEIGAGSLVDFKREDEDDDDEEVNVDVSRTWEDNLRPSFLFGTFVSEIGVSMINVRDCCARGGVFFDNQDTSDS